jgi:phosphoserine phosphatase
MSEILPSWSDGPSKAALLAFVSDVTEPGRRFVPPPERIATFDNDGTLWCEKPMYVQADFIFRRWKELLAADPKLAADQPFKALAEGDRAWLAGILDHVPDLISGVTEAWGGITTTAFDDAVRHFFATASHPTLGIPYTGVGFRPMRELLDLLRAHDFRIFICSAGGRDFVRNVSEELYGVPRENVIGSGTTLEYRERAVYRTQGIEQPIDDGPGKPVHIWMRTGRAPLFAAGNADGDMAMLETARFGLLVHHDDAAREFDYTAGAEEALKRAPERGWVVVSVKKDWTTVFAARAQ